MQEFKRMPTRYEIEQKLAENNIKYRRLCYFSCAIAFSIILLNMIIRGGI